MASLFTFLPTNIFLKKSYFEHTNSFEINKILFSCFLSVLLMLFDVLKHLEIAAHDAFNVLARRELSVVS